MATPADVTAIALSLPGVMKDPDYFAFGLDAGGKRKLIAWVWRERIHPKQARVPNPKVIGVRVADEIEKATLLGADPDKFFTEPHYNGYPAVLVRLANVTKPELRSLLTEAHRCMAPKRKQLAATTKRERPAATRKRKPAATSKRKPRATRKRT